MSLTLPQLQAVDGAASVYLAAVMSGDTSTSPAIAVHLTGDNDRVLLTFSSRESLVAALDTGQPWVEVRTADLAGIAQAGRIHHVAVDPPEITTAAAHG